ncbi:MAG: YbaK/EbsC family protein [Nostocoides sp.]
MSNTPQASGGTSETPALTENDRSEHPAVARVLATLHKAGVDPQVRHLPDAVRTAPAAAEALGVTPAEIANSLIFAATTGDHEVLPLLILASGGHRVDTDKVAAATGLTRIKRADPEFVRSTTGFVIGGVAPVGHLCDIRTIVDRDLEQFETVWAAAGHSHSVFATSYAQLLALTGGEPMDVA